MIFITGIFAHLVAHDWGHNINNPRDMLVPWRVFHPIIAPGFPDPLWSAHFSEASPWAQRAMLRVCDELPGTPGDDASTLLYILKMDVGMFPFGNADFSGTPY